MISPKRIYVNVLLKGRSKSVRTCLLAPSSSPAMAGTIQPSGRFSMGFVPRKKLSQKDLTYQANCDTWDCTVTSCYKSGRGVIKRYSWVQSRNPHRFIDTPYLGKIQRSRRGLRGLTQYAKKYIRESCYILESKYGVKNLGFYTLTIPTCSLYEAWEVVGNWTRIVKYFFKLLRNYCVKKTSKPLYYVGVHEIQPERSARDSIPYYHAHFVMPCYLPGTWEWIVSSDTFRSIWRQSIIASVPTLRTANFGASVDTSVVRKSASGYLSKYFSKGSSLTPYPSCSLLSSWYYSSTEMKAMYKSSCTRLSSDDCIYLVNNLTNSSVVEYWDWVTTKSLDNDREVIRGYWGQLVV